MFWANIWGTASFVGALNIAAFLIAYKIEKKRHWIIKLLLLTLLTCVISFGYNEILRSCNLDPYINQFYRIANCILLFLCTMIAMKACCICNRWEALFCCAASYCMQHITQRLSVFASDFIFRNPTDLSRAFLLILFTTVIYSVIFYKWIRTSNYNRIIADSKIQIIIAITVLLVTIVMSAYAGLLVEQYQAYHLKYYIYGFSIISGILALFVEFCLLFQKNTEVERDILQQLMYENQNQYYLEKSTIDIINIKCHDLKHQFQVLEQKLTSENLQDLKQAVNAYDFIFKTGNTALDTVLTMKGLLCEDKKIIMTCIADGKSLAFMSDSDLYSLFGNILDNAIEAVDLIPQQDKRIVGLTITRKQNFLLVHSENYYAEELFFVDGLPQTTKLDKAYHGFGMHSIKMLTEKYQGTCSVQADDGMFHMDLMFPVTSSPHNS